MRFKEFKPLQEGGSSGGTRYNSEIGMLLGFCGADISNFDPKNPAASFTDTSSLGNSDRVFAEIQKFLPSVYDSKKLASWYKIGVSYKNKVDAQLAKLNLPVPTQFDWAGGSNINEDGAADIIFVGHKTVQGVSIKDSGGITLANLTPKALGLGAAEGEEGDADVFQFAAKAEYDTMKRYAFEQVLNLAMATPGKPIVPIKSKYRIVYDTTAPSTPATAPTAKSKTTPPVPAGSTPGIANQQAAPGATKIPMGQEPTDTQPLSEQQSTGIFTCIFDETKEFKGTYDQIMNAAGKNAEWQRVFGDWFQKNWSSDSTLKQYGNALFTKVSQVFVNQIKSSLSNNSNLQKVLRMGDMAYFYATPKSIYYVPGVSTVEGLAVQDVIYTPPKGTAQYFKTTIGYAGGTEPTEILIYVRYANGIFARNPTVRVQKLINPEGICWVKL
jgi:hypothetical protein